MISEYIVELSSSVITTILFDTRISSVRPVYPSTPLNGAIILPLFNFIKISPFLTKFFNFKSSNKSSFLILNVLDFFDIAVPNVSIFSENSFSITSVTIIPGGGLLLNFFLK